MIYYTYTVHGCTLPEYHYVLAFFGSRQIKNLVFVIFFPLPQAWKTQYILPTTNFNGSDAWSNLATILQERCTWHDSGNNVFHTIFHDMSTA